mmetsp:Transcript_29266/g.70613  ORF Transcript_29266/g.70613 Transcript_29266/m.70613 type:complete len:302 (-) Transcript_29266:1390-2295(-)
MPTGCGCSSSPRDDYGCASCRSRRDPCHPDGTSLAHAHAHVPAAPCPCRPPCPWNSSVAKIGGGSWIGSCSCCAPSCCSCLCPVTCLYPYPPLASSCYPRSRLLHGPCSSIGCGCTTAVCCRRRPCPCPCPSPGCTTSPSRVCRCEIRRSVCRENGCGCCPSWNGSACCVPRRGRLLLLGRCRRPCHPPGRPLRETWSRFRPRSCRVDPCLLPLPCRCLRFCSRPPCRPLSLPICLWICLQIYHLHEIWMHRSCRGCCVCDPSRRCRRRRPDDCEEEEGAAAEEEEAGPCPRRPSYWDPFP